MLLIVVLLVLGGTFAGLTIGLMTLDEVNLEVLSKCGSARDREYASKIIPVRKDGYFLLVSLLLANTIINETLPILADDILGNGWEAIIISTFLLLVFAELIPQAACTRYGLMIGAKCVWLVRVLMFVLYPIAYPTARLLEHVLGKHEKGLYKRSELKELVKIMGESKIDLSADEVLMVGGVLELRDKTPKSIMTPLDGVFMLSYYAELDSSLLKLIQQKGYSRVPVFKDERTNILGMLLVKSLLFVDPESNVCIKDLKLAPLPRFMADHSLFLIFHEFKLGKSHMGIVESVVDGQRRPIGVVTMEDLIEELIQQEIADETDEKLLEIKDMKGMPRQVTLQGYLLQEMRSNPDSGRMHPPANHQSSRHPDDYDLSELLLDNKHA